MKKIILLLFLTPFLMATQCEDDDYPPIYKNKFKIKITGGPAININDTIWFEGRVSSNAYNAATGDSIFDNSRAWLQIDIHKFTTPTAISNTIDAKDKFDIIDPNGLVSSDCLLSVTTTLDSIRNLYKFKFGLKAKSSGDYYIRMPYDQPIENTVRNLSIVNNYPCPNNSYLIGFNECGEWYSGNEFGIGDYCFKVN